MMKKLETPIRKGIQQGVKLSKVPTLEDLVPLPKAEPKMEIQKLDVNAMKVKEVT
jgi:hypothetical protein